MADRARPGPQQHRRRPHGARWDPGKRSKPATRAQAIEALRHQVPACTKCRPDTALSIVDRCCGP
ncbi:DUF6233 domain-containing protein [Streptomyces massasporeus]|uniref:DUF6233 domain-containing protein n=1 Tax=Streptomyces massasporeus TaxID=67324 RepID=UPI0033D28F05